jgi:hypothetical protein
VGLRRTTADQKNTGGTPAPLGGGYGDKEPHLYVSAKRTHFVFAYFFLYQLILQELMSFAGAFANGFVLGKRTQFQGVIEG